MQKRIKIRRGGVANLPNLEIGEPAFTTDTKELFIGSNTGNVKINMSTTLTDEITGQDYQLCVRNGDLYLRVIE